ncbi:CTLH/CRA C-terminal to lish motif domain-containing protein [Myxozyma melibiosi]|uniref:CTLH/CRA C-terminal to lish motif domain-containing protein n=1 Tax=Myxozyma melibiosi TaxID=54550 RepID=A0ABR1F9K3_9ASCO
MDSVLKEYGRLQKSGDFGKYVSDIDQLLGALQKARNTINSAPQSRREQLALVKSSTTAFAEKIGNTQKDIHSSLSKYSKALDKKFKIDIETSYNRSAFPPSSRTLLDRAIAMHLIREGHFEPADKLIKDASLSIPDVIEEEFKNMYWILAALRGHDLKPAIDWAASKREKLAAMGSNLEFSLHRLQFIHYLLTTVDEETGEPVNSTRRALQYARENFAPFGERHMASLSKLMCAFLFNSNLEKSPYVNIFLSPSAWDDVAKSFTKEFCSLLGLSSDSPLYLAAAAGAIALPTLLKVGTIMREKHTEWSSENELPVEIPLPESMFQFHAIFVCPVSKEQTTDENPPMMMPCGHIVAKESLGRMSKGNPNQRFKCPYCPNESIPNQAIRVYF